MTSGPDAQGFLWAAGRLRIERAVLAEVQADALAAYARTKRPAATCAAPPPTRRSCDEHVALVNTANKLHALDPGAVFPDGAQVLLVQREEVRRRRRASRSGGPTGEGALPLAPRRRRLLQPDRRGGDELGRAARRRRAARSRWARARRGRSRSSSPACATASVDEHRLFVWDASRARLRRPSPFTSSIERAFCEEHLHVAGFVVWFTGLSGLGQEHARGDALGRAPRARRPRRGARRRRGAHAPLEGSQLLARRTATPTSAASATSPSSSPARAPAR